MSELHVTPKQQAIKLATRRQSDLVQRLIDEAEQKIANTYVEGGRIIIYPDEIWVTESANYEEKAGAIATFLTLYIANGWEAKHENSQRDGSWIELK